MVRGPYHRYQFHSVLLYTHRQHDLDSFSSKTTHSILPVSVGQMSFIHLSSSGWLALDQNCQLTINQTTSVSKVLHNESPWCVLFARNVGHPAGIRLVGQGAARVWELKKAWQGQKAWQRKGFEVNTWKGTVTFFSIFIGRWLIPSLGVDFYCCLSSFPAGGQVVQSQASPSLALSTVQLLVRLFSDWISNLGTTPNEADQTIYVWIGLSSLFCFWLAFTRFCRGCRSLFLSWWCWSQTYMLKSTYKTVNCPLQEDGVPCRSMHLIYVEDCRQGIHHLVQLLPL